MPQSLLRECRHFWFSSSYKNDPHKLGADTAYAKLCFIMMLQHELLMFLVICLINSRGFVQWIEGEIPVWIGFKCDSRNWSILVSVSYTNIIH